MRYARVRAMDDSEEESPSPSLKQIAQKELNSLKTRLGLRDLGDGIVEAWKTWKVSDLNPKKCLESHRKTKNIDGTGRLSTQNDKALKRFATVAFLGTRTNNAFVKGLVNGKVKNLLLGTGVTMTISKPEVVTSKNWLDGHYQQQGKLKRIG